MQLCSAVAVFFFLVGLCEDVITKCWFFCDAADVSVPALELDLSVMFDANGNRVDVLPATIATVIAFAYSDVIPNDVAMEVLTLTWCSLYLYRGVTDLLSQAVLVSRMLHCADYCERIV